MQVETVDLDNVQPIHQVEECDVIFPSEPKINENEHRLSNTFCIWSRIVDNSKMSSEAFSSNLSIIGCFNTVESFWKHYLYLNRRPSYENYDVSFFRYGVKPMWEDKECENGGTLLFTCLNRQVMDRFFEVLLLAMVGEQFFPPDMVLGVVYRFRSSHNVTSVQIWFKNFDQKAAENLCFSCKRLTASRNVIRHRIMRHKTKFTQLPSQPSS